MDEKMESYLLAKALRCPVSGQPLYEADTDILSDLAGKYENKRFLRKSGHPIENTISEGFVTEDRATFYPIIDGIPQLLAPEGISLTSPAEKISVNLPQYSEPYAEMESYDQISENHLQLNEADSALGEALKGNSLNGFEHMDFPLPADIWLDAKGCVLAQEHAYRYLNPIQSSRVLQIGGHGSHLIKFLMASADEAWLLSPMLGELKRAKLLAQKFGVENRLVAIQGIAEEVPIQEDFFDRIYSGGCLHHTQIEMVGPEIKRILKPGGKASFVDPIMTLPYKMFVRPFYSRGIGRVDEAHCTPISPHKMVQFTQHFSKGQSLPSRTFVHFPLIMATRYLKLNLSISTIRFLEQVDHFIASIVPFVRKRFAPIAAICVQK